MFKEWKRNIFIFVEYIFLVPDEGFYNWIIGGEVQIVWTWHVDFQLYCIEISYSVLANLGWDETFTKRIKQHGVKNPVNKLIH